MPGVHIEPHEVIEVEFQPVQSGRSEDDGIIPAFAEPIDPGGHVAAQGLDVEVRPQQQQLVPAAHRRGAHGGTWGERKPRLGRVGGFPNQEHVLRRSPWRHRGDGQPIRLPGLQVLVAVDGEVDRLVEQGLLDFLGEKPFAFEFFERLDLLPVTLRGEDVDVAGAPARFDEVPYVVGLLAGEIAAAGADSEVGGVAHGVRPGRVGP